MPAEGVALTPGAQLLSSAEILRLVSCYASCDTVWCGVVWCGVVWCGVVWCGVVWCGVVWCGVVCASWPVSQSALSSPARPGPLRCGVETQGRRALRGARAAGGLGRSTPPVDWRWSRSSAVEAPGGTHTTASAPALPNPVMLYDCQSLSCCVACGPQQARLFVEAGVAKVRGAGVRAAPEPPGRPALPSASARPPTSYPRHIPPTHANTCPPSPWAPHPSSPQPRRLSQVPCGPPPCMSDSPPAALPDAYRDSFALRRLTAPQIRLTGGEPTLRRDIVPLVEALGGLRGEGLRDVAITSNGIVLGRSLPALQKAGARARARAAWVVGGRGSESSLCWGRARRPRAQPRVPPRALSRGQQGMQARKACTARQGKATRHAGPAWKARPDEAAAHSSPPPARPPLSHSKASRPSTSRWTRCAPSASSS
jgi:hypothetical protein